jgi:hypothetical protein
MNWAHFSKKIFKIINQSNELQFIRPDSLITDKFEIVLCLIILFIRPNSLSRTDSKKMLISLKISAQKNNNAGILQILQIKRKRF